MRNILENIAKCYGCSACSQICAPNAITMKKDEKGFLYPSIDQAHCNDCGKCREVCPAISLKLKKGEPLACYAVAAPDEIRCKSASGGAFYGFAKYILELHGVICAAAYSSDFSEVRHILVTDQADLDQLRKSKYIQSNPGIVFSEIRKALGNNQIVLFTGSPCQVAGLKNYLGEEYQNLFTIDLVCGHAPAPEAWKLFLSQFRQDGTIVSVDMMDKTQGWGSNMRLVFQSGREYRWPESESDYISALKEGFLDRACCQECPFPYRERPGDVTIGNFWGIENVRPLLTDQKGVSLVAVNSAKGEQLFTGGMRYLADRKWEVPWSQARRTQNSLHRSFHLHPGADCFWDLLKARQTFTKALHAGLKKKYDFGIIGFWFSKNYGAALTSYALCKVLEVLGLKPVLLDIPSIFGEKQFVREEDNPDRRFISRHCATTKAFEADQLRELNELCLGFIVGSDSLWSRPENHPTARGNAVFCDFVYDNKRIISYGTSFSDGGYRGNRSDREITRYLLNRFQSVSVRESQGLSVCEKLYGIHADFVLDPVFLLDSAHYLELARETPRADEKKEKYIAAYLLHMTEEAKEAVQIISRRKGLPVVIIGDMNEEHKKVYPGNAEFLGPVERKLEIEDWLYYISHAEYVITDSYHGFCFSILFERPFICLKPRDGFVRFESLASVLGLEDYIGADRQKLRQWEKDKEIDYAVVKERLEREKLKSLQWLKMAVSEKDTEKEDNPLLSEYGMGLINQEYQRKLTENKLKEMQARMENLERITSLSLAKLILNERLRGKRVAINGAGEHTIRLLTLLDGQVDVRCIVAKEACYDIPLGYPLISAKDLSDYGVDAVLLSSFSHRAEMRREIERLGKYEIVDIYEILSDQGIYLDTEYFHAVPRSEPDVNAVLARRREKTEHRKHQEVFGNRSYAQHGEDLILQAIFSMLGIVFPSYLDVGAHHPYTDSNTAFLYLNHCRGINIEANPDLIHAFFEERPEDINLNIGIIPEGSETMPFYRFNRYSQRNTLSANEMERVIKQGLAERVDDMIQIPTRTLQSVIEQYRNGEWPDLLDIDIEGMDYEVLKKCHFGEKGPAVILAEARMEEQDKFCKLMEQKGYYLYLRLWSNDFFIRRDLEDYLTPFDTSRVRAAK